MPTHAPAARRSRRRAPPARRATRTPGARHAAPPVPPPTPAIVVGSPTGTPRVVALPEPPHTHLVCRSCARILELPMEFDDQQTLESLLLRAPSGWVVDSITVSMTGACARCRQGPSS